MITVNQLLNASAQRNEIVHVEPDTMVIDAIRLMDEKNVGALLVLLNNQLVGIFSERDYTRKVVLENRTSNTTSVGEIMTRKVKTVSPSHTVGECLTIMSDHRIRHLPVIEKSTPIGILSIMDVVRSILSEKEFIINRLENYITDTTG